LALASAHVLIVGALWQFAWASARHVRSSFAAIRDQPNDPPMNFSINVGHELRLLAAALFAELVWLIVAVVLLAVVRRLPTRRVLGACTVAALVTFVATAVSSDASTPDPPAGLWALAAAVALVTATLAMWWIRRAPLPRAITTRADPAGRSTAP
jgi:hypothetical protein